MPVKVPLLVGNCQSREEEPFGDDTVHLAAHASLALSKRLCRKEKCSCPSSVTHVSSSSFSAFSSAFVASALRSCGLVLAFVRQAPRSRHESFPAKRERWFPGAPTGAESGREAAPLAVFLVTLVLQFEECFYRCWKCRA